MKYKKFLLVGSVISLFLFGFVFIDYLQDSDDKIIVTIPQKATMTTPSGDVVTGEMIDGELKITKYYRGVSG